MVDLRARDNMGFADSLESVNSLSVTLPTLHISRAQGKKGYRMKVIFIGGTYLTCMTFPKLPFPTTFNNSKSSMVNGIS